MTTETLKYSRPWLPEEMIQVDGYSLVYTAGKRKKPVVHIPGRKSATLEQLKQRGCRVTLPAVWRMSDFV